MCLVTLRNQGFHSRNMELRCNKLLFIQQSPQFCALTLHSQSSVHNFGLVLSCVSLYLSLSILFTRHMSTCPDFTCSLRVEPNQQTLGMWPTKSWTPFTRWPMKISHSRSKINHDSATAWSSFAPMIYSKAFFFGWKFMRKSKFPEVSSYSLGIQHIKCTTSSQKMYDALHVRSRLPLFFQGAVPSPADLPHVGEHQTTKATLQLKTLPDTKCLWMCGCMDTVQALKSVCHLIL